MWRILLIFCLSLPAWGLDEDWRVQRLNERYEDFFHRLKQQEEWDKKREAGAFEVIKERLVWSVKTTEARNEFIAMKKKEVKPDLGPAYKEWEAQQAKYAAQLAKARQEYVATQNRIHLLERTAKKIPENLEYDLNP